MCGTAAVTGFFGQRVCLIAKLILGFDKDFSGAAAEPFEKT